MFTKYPAVILTICLVFGMVASGGEIVPDSSAPRGQQPEVLATAGGITQVNIKSPSASGVSYNRYQQFDVTQRGAILNNGTGNSNTQLGGWIEGNPNLVGGPARVILNEVNSSRPSSLNGYLEVAGQRADVVIANPSGINVDGFGFLNANRGILTTGSAQFDANGGISGYRVNGGHINIGGAGLDGRGADYTEIISRTAAINAGIWANNVSVVTGHNTVSHDSMQVTPITQSQATGVSLDVSALGGMYAGAIRLVGTDKGLGVRNSGNLVAQVGEVVVTSDGRLESTGVISGKGGVRLEAKEELDLSGTVSSGGDLSLKTGMSYDNTIELAAEGTVSLTAGQNISNSAAGILQGGAGVVLSAQGGSVVNDGQILGGGSSAITALTDVVNTGQILVNDLTVNAGGNIINTGIIDGGVVVMQAGAIENTGAGTILGDHVALGAGAILNGLPLGVDGIGTSGLIGARNRLDLGATTIINREDGLLYSGGDMAVGGSLDGQHQATGRASTLLNSSAIIDVAGDFSASIDDLTNFNAHFATTIETVGSNIYNALSGDGGQIFTNNTPGTNWSYLSGGDVTDSPIINGTIYTDFYNYYMTETTSETKVTASRPGQILVGGSFNFDGVVNNNKSRILVGGVLQTAGLNFNNTAAEGERRINLHGDYQWLYMDGGRRYASPTGSFMSYDPADIVTHIELDVAQFATYASAPMPGQSSLALNLNANLFTLNPSPTSSYLVESNPRLTNYRTWLSSDFILGRLNVDPSVVQKRLGDGFYEQRLIREQIMGQTGQRYLNNYLSDEEQYMALMTAGVDFAEAFGWEFGVSLTPEMMARLTSDIVWMELVTVDTPDGPVTALAPKVYLAPGRESLIHPQGTLVAAREVRLDIQGDVNNSGNIYGKNTVTIAANDINNSGIIAGQLVSLAALRDLNNIGGAINGVDAVDLKAGRDITIASSMNSSTNGSGARTNIDRVGSVSVTSDDGLLTMKAERDIKVNAGMVTSEGSAVLSAGRDLTIGTVQESSDTTSSGESGTRHLVNKTDVGSMFYTGKDLLLAAGNDVNVVASQVIADGDMSIIAGNNVSITEGRAWDSADDDIHTEQKGFLSKSTTDIKTHGENDRAIGSDLSGKTVAIQSGNDFLLRGSTVAATDGLSVDAGGDITILGADNYSALDRDKKVESSGFSAGFSGGRIGVSYDQSKETRETKTRDKTITSSLLGSENGDVSLYAGKDVKISGSNVLAGTGDLFLSGENVTIDNQYNESSFWEKNTYKSSGIGLSVGLSGALGDLAGNASNLADTLKRTQEAKTDRAQTLYGIAAAREGYDLANNAVAAGKSLATGGTSTGVSVRLGVSTSSSESTSESNSKEVVGSHISSGGDTTIVARGKGEDGQDGTGDLNIIGSTVDAGGWVTLAANNDINLLSAEETSSYHNENKNSSGGVGVSVGFGTGGFNVGADFSASKGKGNSDGSTTDHIETVISGGQGVEFASVNDTMMKGAQIHGNTVIGTVGGDLTIISEQDEAKHHVEQKSTSISGSVTVGTGASGASASFSTQSQNADSDYKSVNEQSGIFAGSGGFDIAVGGHTGLTGAVIDSDAPADDNILVTGSISTSDIDNESSYSAKTKGFGLEFGDGKGSISPSLPMKESGDDSSTTHSAVAPGTVIITDEAAQLAHAGQTSDQAVDTLNRDTKGAHSGPLDHNPDLQEILDKQAELADAAAQAGKAVAKTVGDISSVMYLKTDGDPKWGEGGIYKVILQGAGAGLVAQLGNGEGVNAALGAMASQLASKDVRDIVRELVNDLVKDPSGRESLTNLLVNSISSAIGMVAGGETGANAASNMDRNNRQLHREEKEYIKQLATKEDGTIDEEEYERYEAAAAYLVSQFAGYEMGSPEYIYYLSLAMVGMTYTTEVQDLKRLQNEFWFTEFSTAGANAYIPFSYPGPDKELDAMSSQWASYKVGTRILGTVQAAGGAGLVLGGATLEVGTAGVSTAVSLVSIIAGSMQMQAGIETAWKGNQADTAFVEFMVQGGVSREEARRWETISLISLTVANMTAKSSTSISTSSENSALIAKEVTKKSQGILDDFATSFNKANQSDTGISWGQGIQKQGLPWEEYFGKVNGISDNALPANFKTFDYFNKATGNAISNKTIDLAATSYQDANKVLSTLSGYVDDVADFKEYALKGMELSADQIKARTLAVAMPAGATPQQISALAQVKLYALQKGVDVAFTIIHP